MPAECYSDVKFDKLAESCTFKKHEAWPYFDYIITSPGIIRVIGESIFLKLSVFRISKFILQLL